MLMLPPGIKTNSKKQQSELQGFKQRSLHAQRGFSFLELMFVCVLLLILVGFSLYFFELSRGERYKCHYAAEQVKEAIDIARHSAWLGVDDFASRTVDFRKIPLSDGVTFVTEVPQTGKTPNPGIEGSGLPPGIPILSPDTKITFEEQTAKTKGKVWGIIIVRDNTGRAEGLVIPYINGPVQRLVKYRGETQYRPMTNSVY